MPVGSRVRANNVFGLVTDNPLTASSTTLNSNGLANLPAISSTTQHAIITLDPLRVNGAPEIIVVTIHINLATVVTVTRGAFGTTARSHPQGTLWTHTPMNEDYVSIVTSTTRPADPYQGELIYETDTGLYKNWTGTTWTGISGVGLAGGTLAFQTSALDQTAATGDTLTGLSMVVTVPAGRLLRISASSQVNSSATSNWLVDVYEDGVVIGRLWLDDFPNVNSRTELDGFVLRSPSAGTHTYSFIATRFGGSGTLLIEGTAQGKRSIVEDVTASATPFNNASVPVGEIGYAVAPLDTAVSSVQDIVSVTVLVAVGRVIKITAGGQINNDANAGTVIGIIKEGATEFGRTTAEALVASATTTHHGSAVISPTAGIHTYKLTGQKGGAGTATFIGAQSGGTAIPQYILVEDITPTPAAASGAPSSTLAYAEVVANQGSITTEVDLTGLSVTVNVPAGRRLLITGNALAASTIANDRIDFVIQEDGVQIQNGAETADVASQVIATQASIVRSPSAGSHTYKLRMGRGVGTGTITMTAASTIPAFLLVEDITGAIWPAGSSVSTSLVASEAWTTYVPTITQSGSVTNTVAYARYLKIGRQVTFQWLITIVGTGAASNAVAVSLPVPPFNTGGGAGERMIVGSAQIFDTSASSYYQGLAAINGAGVSQLIFYPTNAVAGVGTQFLGLSQFTAALASGDVLTGTVVYESAS